MARRVKILKGNAGIDFSFDEGQIVEINPRNADYLECAVRGGLACYEGDDLKKNNEPEVSNENPDIHDSPPVRTRGRRATRKTDESEG